LDRASRYFEPETHKIRRNHNHIDHRLGLNDKAKNQEINRENNGLINNLRQHSMPKGSIIIWSGSIDDIPEGSQLCNGIGRAPDLRNRLIVGAGGQFRQNDKGGSNQHDHTVNIKSHPTTTNREPTLVYQPAS